MFHPCQNPSVYTDPSGKLRMLANAGSKRDVGIGIRLTEAGTVSIRISRPAAIAPSSSAGASSITSSGASRGLWSKPADAPNSAYEDVVRKGLDFYDGLAVPAITEIPGGRFLMAAMDSRSAAGAAIWLSTNWSQFPDGRIGSKWMKEIMLQQPRKPDDARGEGYRNDDIPGQTANRSC